MGKRSSFEPREGNYWPTPIRGVVPLVGHFKAIGFPYKFAEPCAGDGTLIRVLKAFGHTCTYAADIDPKGDGIAKADALELERQHVQGSHAVITNPPFDLAIPLIERWLSLPILVWVLLPLDFLGKQESHHLVPRIAKLLMIGRLKWIPDSEHSGKDHHCWACFATDRNFVGSIVGQSPNIDAVSKQVAAKLGTRSTG